MALQVIPKKKIPAPPIRKFKRIQELPPEKSLELENMLLTGEPVSEVARHVAGWGVFNDLKESSLYQLLNKYKAEVIQPKIAMNYNGLLKTDKAKALKRATEAIDLAAEFADLIVLQKHRLNKMMIREEGLPVVLDTVSREMRLLLDVLRGYSSVKVDAGMARRLESGDTLANVNMLNVQAYDNSTQAEVAEATYRILAEVISNEDG